MIKFEKCKGYEDIATIPKRATRSSAGYDFYNTDKTVVVPAHGTAKIVTGIKAQMYEDIVLLLYIRSSLAIKKGLMLSNCVPVIDSDFYGDETREGNIIIALYNTTDKDVTIEPYERIVQGIFTKYYTTFDDNVTEERIGGVGSTGRK